MQHGDVNMHVNLQFSKMRLSPHTVVKNVEVMYVMYVVIIKYQYFYTSEHKKSDVVIGPMWRDIPLYSPTDEYNSKNKLTKWRLAAVLYKLRTKKLK